LDYPLRKIEQSNPLSAVEREALIAACGTVVSFPAHTDIISEGDKPGFSTVLLEGLICRYKTLADGERQILAFHTAGDWPDLHSYFLNHMDHALATMSPCRVAQIPHPVLRTLIQTHPRLAELLWRETMLDSAIFREWVVNLGARDAHRRTAHLFCELQTKLLALDLADEEGFELPLTQADLADAVGVSAVHINRVLQQLKRDGLVTYGRGIIAIHDWEKLQAIAGFDPGYLHMHEPLPLEQLEAGRPSAPVAE
jgi:CRP-like cAMP-binding protein